MKIRFVVLLGLGVVVACGGESDGDGGGSGGSGGAAAAGTGATGSGATGSGATGSGATGSGGTGGGAGGSFSVDIGPIDVPAGYENTQCVIKRLGNPAGFKVGQIHNVISSSSHHLIVYKTSDTVEKTTPFDCQPFVETLDAKKGSPIMITQKYDDVLQLPPGVAFTLEENQMIRLELHFINTGSSTKPVTATSTFTGIDEASFKDEADFLFIGNPDISIDPNSTFKLGPTFFPLPAELGTPNFFALTGHTHQYGTNVTVGTAASKGAAVTPVYDVPGWSWSEPETVTHDPPFQAPQGGGFSFTCEYKNTSSNKVTFGESANQEMCFFWAYYYPSKGAKVCFHTDQPGFPVDACCPGSVYCSFLGL